MFTLSKMSEGGDGLFVITDLPNLFWYTDPAYPGSGLVLPSDGTALSSWVNKANAGANFSQGTGTNQPTFRLNGINNRMGVLFDGSNDSLSTTGLSISTDMTFYFVHAPFAGGTTWLFDTNSGVSSARINFGFFGGSFRAGLGTTNVTFGTQYLFPQVNTLILNKTDNISQLFVNGTQLGSNGTCPSTIAFGSTTRLGIGASSFAAYDGYIGPVIGISRVSSTAERKYIEMILGNRYGINISS